MAEILWDGSSHTQGHGDEHDMGGYVGRAKYAYWRYEKTHVYPYTMAGKPGGRNVSHHDRSNAGKTLFEINATLARHVDMIRLTGRKGRMVGIFDIGLYWQNRAEEVQDESLAWWEQQLDIFHRICKDKDITPIVVGSPVPLPESLWLNGRPTNHELLGRLAVLTAEHTSTWAEAYISPEKVLGADKTASMNQDRIHLNAEGYRRMAQVIIPSLNEVLDIAHNHVPLPDR